MICLEETERGLSVRARGKEEEEAEGEDKGEIGLEEPGGLEPERPDFAYARHAESGSPISRACPVHT